MNQIKIGKFMAAMRKKQNLSQRELAEKIGVSDKTISKWETGNSMPDASLLLELCSILKIDVNELLSGEEFHKESVNETVLESTIPIEEYTKKAEDNIVYLIGELNDMNKQNNRNDNWYSFNSSSFLDDGGSFHGRYKKSCFFN